MNDRQSDKEKNRFSARAMRYGRVGANVGGVAARIASRRLFGFVRTSKRGSPLVEMPIETPKSGDNTFPILAYWQTGLGKSVAFTGDAHNRWSAEWVGSPIFQKFWAQVVRGVSRPPMSTDFEVQTNQDGGKRHGYFIEP